MSKKKGPFLIADLAAKIGAAPSPTRSVTPSTDTDHARNAYGFIAANYQSGKPTPEQSGSNQVQIEAESGSKRVQNQVQNGFKTGSEKNPSNPVKIKSGSESGSTLVQNGFKSGSKRVQSVPSTAGTFDVLMARGDQRRVLDYFFDLSVSAGDRSTPALSSAEIGNALQMPQESVRTALKRLLQRGAISRRNFQRGRSGWSRYELSQTVYRELLDFRKTGSNWVQNGFKTGSKTGSESGSTVPSSSSSLDLENLKTTTTSEADFFANDPLKLSPEWEALDFSPLSEIGFTQTHLIQIARQGKVTAQDTQESIEYFAFDLKRNQKARNLNGSALNFFMGILRKGIPYAPPENYESLADEARRKKREILVKLDAKRRAEKLEIEELEFQTWKATLTPDQKKLLVPWSAREGSPGHEAGLREYFKNKKQAGEGNAEAQAIGQQIESSLAMTSSLQEGI